MNLLVMNYSMNAENQVFSHQKNVVKELSQYFNHIDVITSEMVLGVEIHGVSVRSTNWIAGHNIRNIIQFYRVTFPILLKHRKGILFSHMTEVQSFLVLLLCKFLGIKHYLWYAHKSPSLFLRLCYPIIDGLITSTSGSCPISGTKVRVIGQAVENDVARQNIKSANVPPVSWYHIGRIDPSKNIEMLIRNLSVFYLKDKKIQLHIYGEPSSIRYLNYYRDLKDKIHKSENSKWVFFHGKILRSDLVEVSQRHDAFIHAYWGSLDKSVIEAVLLKRIVVSSNPEYLREFENRSIEYEDFSDELSKQLVEVYHSDKSTIQSAIERKFQIGLNNHTLSSWIAKLVSILKEAK